MLFSLILQNVNIHVTYLIETLIKTCCIFIAFNESCIWPKNDPLGEVNFPTKY